MVTDEYFNRVTQALVIRLRQLEDTAEQEGIPTFSISLRYILLDNFRAMHDFIKIFNICLNKKIKNYMALLTNPIPQILT